MGNRSCWILADTNNSKHRNTFTSKGGYNSELEVIPYSDNENSRTVVLTNTNNYTLRRIDRKFESTVVSVPDSSVDSKAKGYES